MCTDHMLCTNAIITMDADEQQFVCANHPGACSRDKAWVQFELIKRHFVVLTFKDKEGDDVTAYLEPCQQDGMQLGHNEENELIVLGVVPGSPASDARIQPNWILTKVGNLGTGAIDVTAMLKAEIRRINQASAAAVSHAPSGARDAAASAWSEDKDLQKPRPVPP